VSPATAARHDERDRWMTYTTRLTAALTLDEIATELEAEVARICPTTSAAVYLARHDETAYRLTRSRGAARFQPSVESTAPVIGWLRDHPEPAQLPEALRPSLTAVALPAAVMVPVRWRTTLLGFMVLDPASGSGGAEPRDLTVLATLAGHAATFIMAAGLSQAAPPAHGERFGRLTAMIHDIKNSVAALSLLARNAANNLGDPDFQRDAVITLSRTVERMQRLLARLSAPDAESPAPRAEVVDLGVLIAEATDALAAERHVRLVRRLHPIAHLHGDRDALLRVVENLLTNAIEAVDHEGTVTVTLAEEDGHAVISVADTGPGISADYQKRHLFSPFRSTKKHGWGIGLYHTKQAVERQRGQLIVESVEGRGATFTVRLPLRAAAENPPPAMGSWALSRNS
jgi:putative PEP-CTERM system histidine kinase